MAVSREQYDEIQNKNKNLLEEVRLLSEENSTLRKELSGLQFDLIFSRNTTQKDQVGLFLCSTEERDNLLNQQQRLLEEKEQTKYFVVELLTEIFDLKNNLEHCKNDLEHCKNTSVEKAPNSSPVNSHPPSVKSEPIKSQSPKSTLPKPQKQQSSPLPTISQPQPVKYQDTPVKSQNQPVKSQDQSQITFLPISERNNVLFVYEWLGEGSHVLLAGSFNDWKGYPMTRESNKWVATVKLRPGRYEFKIIVDGQWQVDPLVPTFQTPQGITNNFIVVPPM